MTLKTVPIFDAAHNDRTRWPACLDGQPAYRPSLLAGWLASKYPKGVKDHCLYKTKIPSVLNRHIID